MVVVYSVSRVSGIRDISTFGMVSPYSNNKPIVYKHTVQMYSFLRESTPFVYIYVKKQLLVKTIHYLTIAHS